MLQCLPIAFALANASNTYENLLTSEKLLNEITEITYSLYQAKEITKKVYNNIMDLIKL